MSVSRGIETQHGGKHPTGRTDMPQPDRYVSVKIECSSGHLHDICVEVDRQVPPELRCEPSAGRVLTRRWRVLHHSVDRRTGRNDAARTSGQLPRVEAPWVRADPHLTGPEQQPLSGCSGLERARNAISIDARGMGRGYRRVRAPAARMPKARPLQPRLSLESRSGGGNPIPAVARDLARQGAIRMPRFFGPAGPQQNRIA